MMFNEREVLETLGMFREQHLDIRTVTMAISLNECSDEDPKKACGRIYDKITSKAKNLVKTGEEITNRFGIPIINKRVAVTPISIVGAPSRTRDYTCFAESMEKAAQNIGIDFIGGFSASVQKGYTDSSYRLISSIPSALSGTRKVCSSVNLATTRAGINMDAVKKMGEIIKQTAQKTKDEDGIGCCKLVVFANAADDNPFMAGAFVGAGEPECAINIGVSGPGVIKKAAERARGAGLEELAEEIKKAAFKITRVGQLVAREASLRLDVPFGILDLSLAPTPVVGDSVARIIEEFGIEECGAWGSTAALAMLNDAVKKGGTMASSFVGGLSGAFIPVSEDEGMIAAVESGALTLEKLEAMTCVCSVGIDMAAIPGDTPATTVSAIIADEAAIGVFNNKTTAVRLIPVPGKKAGDKVEFGGLLGTAPVMGINTKSSADFINRKGRIPPPINSMRN